MKLTEEEILWLKAVKSAPEKYYLVVGISNVYVYDIIEHAMAFQFELTGTVFTIVLSFKTEDSIF